MQKQLPHLLIKEFESNKYTGKGAPINKDRPQRDNVRHSAILKEQLANAWQEAGREEVVYHTDRHGIYLEFKGEAGFELATKGLENFVGRDVAKRTRLLNVRTEIVQVKNKPKEVTFATVYVPKTKKDALLDKLEQYATQLTKAGNPKNADLLGSISAIRKALAVESFWLDSKKLIPADQPEWCEVWLSSDKDEIIDKFEALLIKLKIPVKPGVLKFPERAVKVICANHSQLATISGLSDDIAEYRRAKITAAFWLDQNNKEQAEWVENILNRLKVSPDSRVAICILDTGVNNGHPLLKPVLRDEDCQTVDNDWGTHDHHMHGTLVAGVTAYGNLQEVLTHNELIKLSHYLESVKILPPKGQNEPALWGYVTAQGIFKAEILAPEPDRIFCMAVAAEDSRDAGRPSSWSGELDQLCSGAEDELKRFIIISAGNVPVGNESANYPGLQRESSVHDPGQSWNALTVGAYTELNQILDPQLKDYEPVAPAGGLSPFSTTSLKWENKWPIKPEILMEGGNLGIDRSGFATECDDLSLLSTYYDPQSAHFYPFNMTSAATAQAAWFAAQIQVQYPDYWPETVRALMVHSADWTENMKAQFLENETKGSYEVLLKACGYGVPELQRALYSASNSLTLIAQNEIQPFAKKQGESRYVTNDLHLYELPWPKEALKAFPDNAEVKMRVTLSYFIEPGPGEIGWKDRYRYASHGLRFELNSPTESKNEFVRRINIAARDEDNGHPGTDSASRYWLLGQARNKGSIHSDIWLGTAKELAESNYIAVFPVIGWWRERPHLQKWDKKARYSLIVSIQTSEQEVDIYTPVAIKLGVVIPVEVSV